MKEKRPIPLYKALKRRIILPAVALWLICMLLLSCAVGKDFYHQLYESGPIAARSMRVSATNDRPGNLEYLQHQRLSYLYYMFRTDTLFPFVLPQTPSSIGSDDWYWGKWELTYGFQAAAAYYDPEGNLTIKSGDSLYFISGAGYGYIDLNDLEGGAILADRHIGSHPIMGDFTPFMNSKYILLSGYYEGRRFYPHKISTDYMTFYEKPAPEDREIISFVPTDIRGSNYEPGAPVWIPDLGRMPIEEAIELVGNSWRGHYTPFNAYVACTAYNEDGSSVRVLYCIRPLAYAAVRLLPTYLVTGILLWVGLWLCLKSVKKHLRDPLEVINRAWENDRAELSVFARSPYLELQTLGAHFNTAQQDRHSLRNQVTQLQTALQFAKNAEENRRKMVSAIAHELKTPLAVIHGYAEGLQDGIAPEKQQQYLSVILDETEKTDALVRQMLELSRLEAGKVRLSADPVDLTALTEAVLQKQSLAAQAKDLQWELDLHPAAITADEARIEQVLSNYISNAIRYSPRGGTIRISLSAWTDHVRFFIENESAPLSQEALEKVWESFYRADTARDRTGTGLGLAITKSIVELHRGTCAVRNTQTGVEFSFRLPTGSASPKTMSS